MCDISVIVATVGRAQHLERLLQCLAGQTLAPERYEVFVVIDGADPTTVEVLKRAQSRFRRLGWRETGQRRGPAAARNLAWRNTAGPVVAMTDDDCEPDADWLTSFLQAFERRPGAAGLLGRTLTDPEKVTPLSHFVENRGGEGHQTCNSAYRRSVLEQVNGFDERFPGAYLEDTDFYCRVTRVAPVEFVSEALVIHPPRPVAALDLARSARKYRSDFIFHQKDPGLYRSRHEGKGPVPTLLWDVGVKHTAKELIRHLPWLARSPWMYARYAGGMLLFAVLLFVEVARCAGRFPTAPVTPAGTGAA